MSNETNPTPEAPAVKSGKGRKPLPRDAEGNIIRPEGYVKPERKSSKTAPVALTFEDGQLKSGDAVYFGDGWTVNGKRAEDVAAEIVAAQATLEAAQKVVADLQAAQAALVGLPDPRDNAARATLAPASLLAIVDYFSSK